VGVTRVATKARNRRGEAVTVRHDHLLELTSSGVDVWHAEEREVAGKRRWEIQEEEKGIIVNLKFKSCFFNPWSCFAKFGLKQLQLHQKSCS